jgi:hypothetical protein
MSTEVEQALREALFSVVRENKDGSDSANVVDGLFEIADGLFAIARAVDEVRKAIDRYPAPADVA